MAWTDENVELLKKLWAEGLSASQIAKQMPGKTRNGVIGKVHRMGLPGRATPTTPSGVRAPRRSSSNGGGAPKSRRVNKKPKASKKVSKELAKLAKTAPPATGLGSDAVLKRSQGTCKWPIGDPATPDFRFCGRSADSGKPYCAEHNGFAH